MRYAQVTAAQARLIKPRYIVWTNGEVAIIPLWVKKKLTT